MVWIKSIAEPRYTSCNLVELDAFFTTIYVACQLSRHYAVGRCIVTESQTVEVEHTYRACEQT